MVPHERGTWRHLEVENALKASQKTLRMENEPIMKGGRPVNEFWMAKSRKRMITTRTRVMIDRARGKRSATKKNSWNWLTREESARTIVFTVRIAANAANSFLPTEKDVI